MNNRRGHFTAKTKGTINNLSKLTYDKMLGALGFQTSSFRI